MDKGYNLGTAIKRTSKPSSLDGGNCRVLLVDQRHLIRASLCATLRAFGHQLAEAGSSAEAHDLIKEREFDTLLITPSLPTPGTASVIAECRATYPKCRCIVLYERSEASILQDCMVSGARFALRLDQHAELLNQAVRGAEVALAQAEIEHHAHAGRKHQALSEREVDVLRALAEGLSAREVAGKLGIQSKTIDAHRRRIQEKLGVDSLAGLTRIAVRQGLVKINSSQSDPKS